MVPMAHIDKSILQLCPPHGRGARHWRHCDTLVLPGKRGTGLRGSCYPSHLAGSHDSACPLGGHVTAISVLLYSLRSALPQVGMFGSVYLCMKPVFGEKPVLCLCVCMCMRLYVCVCVFVFECVRVCVCDTSTDTSTETGLSMDCVE